MLARTFAQACRSAKLLSAPTFFRRSAIFFCDKRFGGERLNSFIRLGAAVTVEDMSDDDFLVYILLAKGMSASGTTRYLEEDRE